MEYVYAALVLHEAKKEITEENVSSILSAVGIDVDASRAKSLIAALADVNIEEALAAALAAPAAAAPAAAAAEAAPAAEEEEEEEEDVDEANMGLGALFG